MPTIHRKHKEYFQTTFLPSTCQRSPLIRSRGYRRPRRCGPLGYPRPGCHGLSGAPSRECIRSGWSRRSRLGWAGSPRYVERGVCVCVRDRFVGAVRGRLFVCFADAYKFVCCYRGCFKRVGDFAGERGFTLRAIARQGQLLRASC